VDLVKDIRRLTIARENILTASEEVDAFIDGPLSDIGLSRDVLKAKMFSFLDDVGLGFDDGPTSSYRQLDLTSVPPLFSYQQEIVGKLNELRSAKRNTDSALISLPTGGGKTRTGIWFFREQLKKGLVRRMLWTAPSVELVEQAFSTISNLWNKYGGAPDIHVRVNGFGRSLLKKQVEGGVVIFATCQLLVARTNEVMQFAPELFVFDEAHQCVARTYQGLLKAAKTVPGSFILGLSATPGRTNSTEGEDLQSLFGRNLIIADELGSQPVAELIRRKVLSRLEFRSIELPAAWNDVRVNSLIENSLSLEKLALNRARFWATVATILDLKCSRILVFASSIAHAQALAVALRCKGKDAAVISHVMPSNHRRFLLRRFEDGDLPILINKSLLATGYDCPGISNLVLAAPIRSPILWEQILGRASRGPAVGGSDIGTIWELDNHRRMHSEVQSYVRFFADLWS
jgi:DNA repair protein RadD